MHTLRDQACIVGVGETAYTRGAQKSMLRLVLEASRHALTDAGLSAHDMDGFVLPGPYLFQEQLAQLPVEVVFDDVTPEVTLPKFRPLPPSAGV